jgi:hypothetical protein
MRVKEGLAMGIPNEESGPTTIRSSRSAHKLSSLPINPLCACNNDLSQIFGMDGTSDKSGPVGCESASEQPGG